jgi:hypothetical protein
LNEAPSAHRVSQTHVPSFAPMHDAAIRVRESKTILKVSRSQPLCS